MDTSWKNLVKPKPWKPRCARIALLAAAAALMAPVMAVAQTGSEVTHRLQGRAVHVMDGDTVRLRTDRDGERTIRLASLDAPEVGRAPGRPSQPYSKAARETLERLVRGARLIAECYEEDSYGRDICDLRLPDGRSVNRELVRAGMAWANMEKRGRFLRDAAMPALEREARAAGRGLWRERAPVAPWQWRYQCWRQQRCP